MDPLPCGLCGALAAWFFRDSRRDFYRCARCALRFADPQTHLSRSAEKAIYAHHQNDYHDSRYRQFLSRLAVPLLRRLQPGMRGLDFGCGPGPALSIMLAEAGMDMLVYDPYYAPDPQVLEDAYDFLTCSEVVEHFCEPRASWEQMVGLLRPGGWLGVMTQMVDSSPSFEGWYYKNDPTHVCFYSATTFAWIAGHFGLKLEQLAESVVLFQLADRREAGCPDPFDRPTNLNASLGFVLP